MPFQFPAGYSNRRRMKNAVRTATVLTQRNPSLMPATPFYVPIIQEKVPFVHSFMGKSTLCRVSLTRVSFPMHSCGIARSGTARAKPSKRQAAQALNMAVSYGPAERFNVQTEEIAVFIGRMISNGKLLSPDLPEPRFLIKPVCPKRILRRI